MTHPTPTDVRAVQRNQERLESYLPCEWRGSVCLTRAKLKRTVLFAGRIGVRSPERQARWHAAVRRLAAHHCEPAPDVTLADVLEIADEYARLYHRAHSSADLIHEREAKRRELTRTIQRYALEAADTED